MVELYGERDVPFRGAAKPPGPRSWSDVTTSLGFQDLPLLQKQQAREQYWNDVVAVKPKFKELAPEHQEGARERFFRVPLSRGDQPKPETESRWLGLLKDPLRGVAGFIIQAPVLVAGMERELGEAATAYGKYTTQHLPPGAFPIAKLLLGKVGKLTDFDEKLAEGSAKFIKEQKAKYAKLDLSPSEDTFVSKALVATGSAVPSLAAAIGLTYITGNPMTPAVAFGLAAKSETYQEAREAGKLPLDAGPISSARGLGEGMLEYVGVGIFMKSYGKLLITAGVRILDEALQEGAQSAWEHLTEVSSFDPDRTWYEIREDIIYSMTAGAVTGGGASVVMQIGEAKGLNDMLEAQGIDPNSPKGKAVKKLFVEAIIQQTTEAAEQVNADLEQMSPEDIAKIKPFGSAVTEAIPTEITWRSGTTGELVSGTVVKVKPDGDYLVETEEGFRTIKPARVLATKEVVEELPVEPVVPPVAEEAPPRVAEEVPPEIVPEVVTLPPELREPLAVWRRTEKELRRAQRQAPERLDDATVAQEEARVEFEAAADRADITEDQHDFARSYATQTQTAVEIGEERELKPTFAEVPRVAEEAPDDTAFDAIERKALDAPTDASKRAAYDAMWAELEAEEAMVGVGPLPLLDALKSEGILISAAQVRRTTGLSPKDFPKQVRYLLRSEKWLRKAVKGIRRPDLTDLDLLAERVFTGDLREIGAYYGFDPDVDLETQLIDILVDEAERWVPPTKRGAKPIIEKPLTGWENTTNETPSAEALREQQVRLPQQKIPFPGEHPPAPTETTEEFREGIKAPHAEAPRPGETAEEFRARIAAEVAEAPEFREIGAKEKFRPARRVFEKIGIRETYEEAFEAEVLLWEGLMKFREEAMAQRETTDMSPESSTRIFRYIEKTLGPKEIEAMTDEERRVAEWGMKFFDEWADRLGIPQHKRRKNYITHIFETAIAADLRQKYPIDPDLVKALDFVKPKQVFMPFLEARIGKTVGLREDFWAAIEAYEAKALKVYYYEPLLKKMNEQSKVLPPNAARYVQEFVGRMTNRPLQIDREIQQDMKEFGEIISKLPGGKELGASLGRGNIGGLISYNITGLMYEAYMGLVPATAIKNLGQNSLTIAETGIVNFLEGVKWRMTKEGRAAIAESLVIRSRKIGYLPGVDESYLRGLQNKRREIAMAMFRRADKINVKNAFAAGYTEAKKLGLSHEWAVKRGDEIAAKTQYVYTKLAGAAWSQSAPWRVASVFTTWPENWLELMIDWGTGKESLVYQDYEKATGDKVGPEGWLARRKQMLRYMMIVALAMYIEWKTELSALTYTGWTSLKSFARMATGDIPATGLIGGAAQLVAGSLTADTRLVKEGWNKIRPDRVVSIVRRIEDIANGKKDWMSLFIYTNKKKKKVELAP